MVRFRDRSFRFRDDQNRPDAAGNYTRVTRAAYSAPMPHEPLASLSPSRASDFKTCPQLFKFRALDRLEEPATTWQARGTTAHLALQQLFDLPPAERSPGALYDLFRRAWSSARDDEYAGLFGDQDAEQEWGVESLTLLANYFGLEDPRTFDPLDRELDVTEEVDGMTIRGILDRIDETPDGDLVITDYKTGKAPPQRYALPAFFALKIYAMLIRRQTGRTPVELRLLYLNGPTMYSIAVTDRQLDAVERHVRALWTAIDRAISGDHFPARTGPLCGYCSFQDRCPAWSEAPAAEPALAAAGA